MAESSDELDQGVLEEELFDVKKKWYNIGLQLKVSDTKLDEIDGVCGGDIEKGLRRMLQEWRKQIETLPSWTDLVKALRCRTVNEQILAKNLEDRYTDAASRSASGRASTQQQQIVLYSTPSPQAALNNGVVMRPDEVPDPEVQDKIAQLHRSFEEIRMKVYEHIEHTKPDKKMFAVFITCPQPSWKIKRPPTMADAHLDRITQPEAEYYQMFVVINQYANWFNYELIKGIVDRYGNPVLKGIMEDYCTKLVEFENNTSAEELKYVQLAQPQPDSVAIIARLPQHHCNQFQTIDIRRLKHTYTNEAGLDPCAARTYMIKKSSVEVIFLVPKSLAPHLIVSSVCPLLASQNPLPEDIHERCVHMLHEEEIFRLMGKRVAPPVLQETTSSESTDTHPVFRSVFSNGSISSEVSAQNESFSSIDPTLIQVFHDKVIMNGDNAVICKAQFLHLPCAAKYIHTKLTDSSSWQLEKFEMGCKILQSCHHPNIVTFLGTYHDNHLGPIMLMELMDESLKSHLEKEAVKLPLHVQLNICSDVAHGLEYLHAKKIIHGDLTATNVLLKDDRAKICGTVSLQQITPETQLSLCPGSAVSLPQRSFSHSDYDEAIDCFSFGVLAIHTVTQGTPQSYPHTKEGSEIKRFERSLEKVDSNHLLHPLIIECLNNDSSLRPSSAKLCQELSNMRTSTDYYNSLKADHMAKNLVKLQLQSANVKIKEKTKEIVDLQKEVEDTQVELERQNKEFCKQLQSVKEQAEQQQMEAQHNQESMKNRIAMLASRNKDLEEKNEASTKEIDERKKKLEDMKKCEAEAVSEKARMRKHFWDEKGKNNAMLKNISELETKTVDLKSKLEESDRSYARLLSEGH